MEPLPASTASAISLPVRALPVFQRPQPRLTKTQREMAQARRATICRPAARVTKRDWLEKKSQIIELYINQGYQRRVVRELMQALYQFSARDGAYDRRFSNWGVKKNKTDGTNRHGREPNKRDSRIKAKPLDSQLPSRLLCDCEFDLHRHTVVPRDLEPSYFKPYERALQSIDRWLLLKFDQGNRGWAANMMGFRKWNGVACWDTHGWRTMSDRCHTVALLIRAGLHGKAEMALDDLLERLGGFDYDHPSFMLMFWRLCLRIQGVDVHIMHARALERLFSTIRGALPENDVADRLVQSLSVVDRSDLRGLLRICFVKAIRLFTELIGDENVMVLDMISYYCKFFDAPLLAREALRAKFQYVWCQTYDAQSRENTSTVAITYAYAYAAYYAFNSPSITLARAEDLRDTIGNRLARELCAVQWTLETEAFSFASHAVAELHRQQVSMAGGPQRAPDAYARCCASLQGAIMRLMDGDRDCRARAIMLSGTLTRWLVEWGLQDEAHAEGLRRRGIEHSIPGKLCRRCLRLRMMYCTECRLLRRANKPRDELCTLCVLDKTSRKVCQRCAIRQSTVGWTPKLRWFEAKKERKESQVVIHDHGPLQNRHL